MEGISTKAKQVKDGKVKVKKTTVEWLITVATNDSSQATSAQLMLTMYGNDGQTQPIAVNKTGQIIEAGKQNKFNVSLS